MSRVDTQESSPARESSPDFGQSLSYSVGGSLVVKEGRQQTVTPTEYQQQSSEVTPVRVVVSTEEVKKTPGQSARQMAWKDISAMELWSDHRDAVMVQGEEPSTGTEEE